MSKKHDNWLEKIGYKEFLIHMGMFDFNIVCAIGKYENLEEYVRFKLEDDELDVESHLKGFGVRGMYFYRAGFAPILWIPRYPRSPEEYGTLAHESLHIVHRLFHWAGMPIDDSTEECSTHAVGYIVRKVLESKKE